MRRKKSIKPPEKSSHLYNHEKKKQDELGRFKHPPGSLKNDLGRQSSGPGKKSVRYEFTEESLEAFKRKWVVRSQSALEASKED